MSFFSHRRINNGFTIVELLIVVAVIAVLASVSVIAYSGITKSANDKALLSDIENVEGEIARYVTKNSGIYGGSVAWYSPGVSNPNIKTTPTSGNVIDVVANTNEYCIRVYNPNSNHTDLAGAEVKGSTPTACASLAPSIAAGGSPICPAGFIGVPGNPVFSTGDFCVMKYEAKNMSGVATSQATGAPWDNISQNGAITASSAACSGCHLMTTNERLTIAHNILTQASNWTSGTVGTGSLFLGANDSSPIIPQVASTDDNDNYINTGNSGSSGANQRRTFTLSNGQVIWDFAGNAWEWTSGTVAGNQQPGGPTSMYREWNTISDMVGLSNSIKPSFGNASISSWTTSRGIGALYSSTAIASVAAMYWGGSTNQYQSTNGGIFNLALDRSSSSAIITIGFRVTK